MIRVTQRLNARVKPVLRTMTSSTFSAFSMGQPPSVSNPGVALSPIRPTVIAAITR